MSLRWRSVSALTACLLAIPAMADAPAGYFKLPGTDTNLQVYGNVWADEVLDTVQPGGVLTGLSGASYKYADNALPKDQWDFTADCSRFGVRTITPSEYGDVTTRMEFDFTGGTESKGVAHIRHFYGQVGGLLVGKTQSNFEDLDGSPNYIDQDGLLADWYGCARWAQVRYTWNFDKKNTLSVSAEQPQTTVGNAPAVAPDSKTSPNGLAATYQSKQIPALTALYSYKDAWGHVALALGYQRYAATYVYDTTTPAGGQMQAHKDSLSWALSGHFQFGDDSFVYHYGIGDGAFGAGLQDGGMWNTSGTSMVLVQDQQFEAGYEHFWTPKVHTNLFVSWVGYKRNADKGMTGNAFSTYQQYGGNAIYDFTKTCSFAVEYEWGFAKTFDNNEIIQADGTTSGNKVHESKLHFQFKFKFF